MAEAPPKAERPGAITQEARCFFGALRFFTRLPTPAWAGHDAASLQHSIRYFPAVGLIVGSFGVLAWEIAAQFWQSPEIVALMALATMLWLTGALHEDGLTDTADGLGGGWEKTRILDIMKDSRVGVFGMATFVLVLLGRYAAMLALPSPWIVFALPAAHAVSRFSAFGVMSALDYARPDATSKARPLTTRLRLGDWLIGGLSALLPCLFLPWQNVLAACLLAALTVGGLTRLYRKWLGGYTGDTLGATQQATELAFYLGLLAHLPRLAV